MGYFELRRRKLINKRSLCQGEPKQWVRSHLQTVGPYARDPESCAVVQSVDFVPRMLVSLDFAESSSEDVLVR